MTVSQITDAQIENFYGNASYHLYDLMAAEDLNIRPVNNKLTRFEERLIQDGFLTLDEYNCFRLTSAGRLLAQAWLASQETRFIRERETLLIEASPAKSNNG
ncbi:hypothetical protein JK182_01650 [Acetobacter okinawensis]|uniref:hypothetical protein n=1 Tax=Acetobacter okinawensis TaxID=1076594 RepID=UPI001BA8BD4D|nr:hypothetical protein [Acetobacter okinawensis]MBS0987397.1 hypothetical protein [Acetobacter okinawensis]